MIAANELRIGNWVKGIVRPKEPVQIKELSNNICKAGEYLNDYEDVLPIFLSQSILEKCGFKRVNHIHGYTFYSLSESKTNRAHIDIYPEKTSWMGYSVSNCKHLHQLQNLYYSLTGKELIITL